NGQHTLWAYCHVPFGCKIDMSEKIESQIERFAPGFRDCISARHKMSAMDLEKSNPNLAGGDINGGAANLWQLMARPILSPTPYRADRLANRWIHRGSKSRSNRATCSAFSAIPTVMRSVRNLLRGAFAGA